MANICVGVQKINYTVRRKINTFLLSHAVVRRTSSFDFERTIESINTFIIEIEISINILIEIIRKNLYLLPSEKTTIRLLQINNGK